MQEKYKRTGNGYIMRHKDKHPQCVKMFTVQENYYRATCKANTTNKCRAFKNYQQCYSGGGHAEVAD